MSLVRRYARPLPDMSVDPGNGSLNLIDLDPDAVTIIDSFIPHSLPTCPLGSETHCCVENHRDPSPDKKHTLFIHNHTHLL